MTRNDERLRNMTIEQLHTELGLETINTRLYDRLDKLWTKMEEKENDIYERSRQSDQDVFRDHNWWPRASLRLTDDLPQPIYVRLND